ncbi:hypothetical protein [Streptomyces ardesiacus]|uniref:hypothetical protein n=1 Tax=Streptomyces ardesiacus TaxID=285564 RepID=UPI0036E32D1A
MSQWNISVRLTGQGAGLSRTLRTLSRDARDASRDIAALRRDISYLRTQSRRPIRLRVQADTRGLRAEIDRAARSAQHGQRVQVQLGIESRSLRREVRDAVRAAARGQSVRIPIRLTNAALLRREVTAAVRRAETRQTIRVRVTADTSGLTRTLTTAGAPAATAAASSASGGLAGLLTLLPALIPLTAGLTANMGALTAKIGTNVAAFAAFGIAIGGQLSEIGAASEAFKAYKEAVATSGETSEEAAQAQLAYQRQLAKLTPESQRALVALGQLKSTYSDWSDEMAQFTMAPVEKGFAVLQAVIPQLTPMVKSTSRELDRLITVAGGGVTTPGFDAMFDRFSKYGDETIKDFTDSIIHLFRVISDGSWDDGALGQILNYMRENGPVARAAINDIGDALGNLVEAGSIAGPSMLTLVTALARLVAALPPELVAIILQTAAALKLLSLAGAGMAALAGRLGAVRAAIAGLAATSAAAGGGLAGLRAAFLSLGVAAKASVIIAGIGLAAVAIGKLMDMGKEAPPNIDKLTTSLGKLGQTGKVGGELGKLGDDLDDLYDKVRNITDPATVDNIQNGLVKVFSLGMADSTPSKEAREWLDAIDESLTNLVTGGKTDLAAAAFERLKAAYAADGGDVSKFTGQMKDYKSALEDLKFEQELAASSQGLFGKAAQDTKKKLDDQKASADGLRQAIVALNDVNRAAGSAMSAFEQSIDDASKAVKDHHSALKLRDGELDLGSQKARDAEKVLSDLAANTEAAATAAREQGKSWEDVNGIYDKGRAAFVKTADAMGLTAQQAEILADRYLALPDTKSTRIEMRTEDAIASLDSVIAAIQATPNRKSVTVDALTSEAITLLKNLGFTVERLPDGRFSVTADTATAKQRLADVQSARNGLKNKTITISAIDAASKAAAAAKAAIERVKDRQVTITARYQTIGIEGSYARTQAKMGDHADGAVVDYYADGGTRETHVAQIARAGEWRVWAEPETMGEAYIPFAPSKRRRSRVIAEETVRRLGGDPRSIDWYASGGITAFASGGFSYAPTGLARDVSYVQSTYSSAHQPIDKDEYNKKIRARANALDALRTAEANLRQVRKGKHTQAQLAAAEARVAKARRSLATATEAAEKAEARYKKRFSLSDWQKTLKSSVKANATYEANLKKISQRGGAEVIDQLRDMGEEGAALIAALAKASNKQFKDIVANLKKLGPLAKASLADYTAQLNASNKQSAEFQSNLAKLSSMGYGDLATMLAEQGDEAAQKIASEAVKSKSAAAKANAAAKQNNQQLSSDEMTKLIQIIAAISNKNTGIHQVADKTGFGEDEIIQVGNKAKAKLSQLLGGKAARFLADLAKANKGQAYENGGIRAGMYATQGGIVRFAEPSTRGEAYIPLGQNKRSSATRVLSDVATRFGLGLTDGQAGRVVIIREQGPLVGESHFHIGDRKSDRDLARAVESQQGYQLRRLARGGVAARGAS